MMERATLLEHLSGLLRPEQYQDYAPNGLQVAGSAIINKLVSGVTASRALIEAAIAQKADTLLVHHGYFWKGEAPCITGMKQARLKLLLQHNINLIAYHLPLDAIADIGNNAQLAKHLNITITGDCHTGPGPNLVLTGHFQAALTPDACGQQIETALGRKPLHIAADRPTIQTVAWCTGAGQDFLDLAADAGVDAFITGEVSERTTHIARERNIHFFAAGHHATERFGVKALGEQLATAFELSHQFIDIDNPA